MKIRPVILCGGSGSRLWSNSKKHQAKQFIDFGGWTLLGKTLERIKGSLFDIPIISTNSKYLKVERSESHTLPKGSRKIFNSITTFSKLIVTLKKNKKNII